MARVTLSDVAKRAGVSRATASLVLRETGSLSDETRARVRESMSELGYVYHRAAAAMRAGRTQSIGLLVPDVSNGFTAEMTVAIERTFAEAGHVTLIANSLEDAARQDLLVRSMLERNVDGLIVMPAVGTADASLERLADVALPVLIATRRIGATGLSFAGIDNLTGGRLAARHLVEHGVRTIAYIGGEHGLAPRHDRLLGAREVLAPSQAEVVLDLPGPASGQWALEVANELVTADDVPEAMICHNDIIAFGVFRALRERGFSREELPRVVSYDEVPAAALWEPPLTTVGARGRDVGASCAEALLARIAGGEAEAVLVAPHLVVRESCGCSTRAAA